MHALHCTPRAVATLALIMINLMPRHVVTQAADSMEEGADVSAVCAGVTNAMPLPMSWFRRLLWHVVPQAAGSIEERADAGRG